MVKIMKSKVRALNFSEIKLVIFGQFLIRGLINDHHFGVVLRRRFTSLGQIESSFLSSPRKCTNKKNNCNRKQKFIQ